MDQEHKLTQHCTGAENASKQTGVRCACCGKQIAGPKHFENWEDLWEWALEEKCLFENLRPMWSVPEYDEAERVFSSDGFSCPGDWLINKYGTDEAEQIVEAQECIGYDKSFECRNCYVLTNKEWKKVIDRR